MEKITTKKRMKTLIIMFAVLLSSGVVLAQNSDATVETNTRVEAQVETGQITACTADAKICSDGSAVGRTGPRCEFAKCPDEAGYTKPEQPRTMPDGAPSDGESGSVEGQQPQPAATDVFIKIGDIKGESKDRGDVDSDDDSAMTDNGTTAEARTKKPKEIVVVGSKLRAQVQSGEVVVRGWDPEKKEVIEGTARVESEEDFATFVQTLTVSDENIEQVSFRDGKTELRYRQPAKLFGLIGVNLETKTQIDEQGRVKVRFPWYALFTTDNAKEIRTDVKTALEAEAIVQHNQTDLEFLRERARALQTISNIMKASHDTAMNSIRNIRA